MAVAVEEALRGKAIFWGAPTYDQVRVGWGEAKAAALGVARFNQSTMLAEFPSGGVIRYRSLDNPDNARGFTADGIVIDESADVAEAAWHEVLRPMLIDTGGWSWAIGTPKGKNWFWRETVAAWDRADSRSWSAPTLGVRIEGGRLIRDPHPLENPEIPFAEMVHLFKTLPERVFRQEILGEFTEDGGGVFRGVRDCVDPGRTAAEPAAPGRSYCMGWDLARVEDFAVLTVIDDAGRQVSHDRFNQLSWERQIDAAVRTAKRYRARVVMDSTGVGDPIFERARAAGLNVQGFQFTNASKGAMVDNLAMRVEGGRLRLMDVPQQQAELEAFEYQLTAARNVRMSAPEGMHDDCVMALGLACWGHDRIRPIVGY
jgi:hypothetical protein